MTSNQDELLNFCRKYHLRLIHRTAKLHQTHFYGIANVVPYSTFWYEDMWCWVQYKDWRNTITAATWQALLIRALQPSRNVKQQMLIALIKKEYPQNAGKHQ